MFVAEYNHGLNRVPLCQALVHPEPQNVTLSGNRLFTDVINVGSSWTRVGQEHMGGPQKLKKARKDPPWNLQKTCSPDNTSVFTLSHYNCERINFCCFRPPRVWAIVRQLIFISFMTVKLIKINWNFFIFPWTSKKKKIWWKKWSVKQCFFACSRCSRKALKFEFWNFL